MCEEVEEREEDTGRLLNAREAVEWPLAMELEDRLEVGRVARKSRLGRDMLAGIVAFRRAVPEQEAVLEGCGRL